MYKKKTVEKTVIEINIKDVVRSNFAYPTIYGFVDDEGTEYSFELNEDFATLTCLDTHEILISGTMKDYNGLCNLGDFVYWAEQKDVEINY